MAGASDGGGSAGLVQSMLESLDPRVVLAACGGVIIAPVAIGVVVKACKSLWHYVWRFQAFEPFEGYSIGYGDAVDFGNEDESTRWVTTNVGESSNLAVDTWKSYRESAGGDVW